MMGSVMHRSHEVTWTKIILEEFISVGGLTKEEEMIMRTRCAGWTITKQANELCMSSRTVDRLIRSCKDKYDVAQKHSLILPPRKTSEKEKFMDNN